VTASTTSEESMVDEPVTVIVSLNGWLRTRQGHGVDRASIQYKRAMEKCGHRNPDGESAHPHGQQRRTYTLRISDLPPVAAMGSVHKSR